MSNDLLARLRERLRSLCTATLEAEVAADALDLAESLLAAQPSGAGEPGKWPAGISDGLTLPCGVCGVVPKFGYNVTDGCWRKVAPPEMRLGVICLPCFDRLATAMGVDIAESIERVQWTGIGKTVVLTPTFVHRYPVPASGGSTEPPMSKTVTAGPIDYERSDVELSKAGYVQSAPEPLAPAPFFHADSGLTMSTQETRTDAAPSLGDHETAAPAPCPVREAAVHLSKVVLETRFIAAAREALEAAFLNRDHNPRDGAGREQKTYP